MIQMAFLVFYKHFCIYFSVILREALKAEVSKAAGGTRAERDGCWQQSGGHVG